jgi:hypothetical protein
MVNSAHNWPAESQLHLLLVCPREGVASVMAYLGLAKAIRISHLNSPFGGVRSPSENARSSILSQLVWIGVSTLAGSDKRGAPIQQWGLANAMLPN